MEISTPSTDSKTFCVLPWVHLANRSNGSVNLCCSDYGRAHDNDVELQLGRDSIKTIWNSTYHRQARLDMLNGRKLKGCTRCYFEEEIGMQSPRLSNLDAYKNFIEQGKASGLFLESSVDGYTSATPTNFDLMLSNQCNLECVMCDTKTSSRINKKMNDLAPLDIQKRFYSLKPVNPKTFEWINNADFWSDLRSFTNQITHLGVTGGEPTLIPEVAETFKYVMNHGKPTEISIFTSTNAMVYNPTLMNIMSSGQWQRATLQVSIDGLGDVQEYVRFPSRWATVWKNFERIAALPHVHLVVNFVLQAYNIENLLPFLTWMLKHKDLIAPERVDIRFLTEPSFLQVSVLPDDVKKRLITSLQQSLDKEEFSPWTQVLHKAIDYLAQTPDPQWLQLKRKEFVEYTLFLDTTRKTNIHSMVSGLENMFASYGDFSASTTAWSKNRL